MEEATVKELSEITDEYREMYDWIEVTTWADAAKEKRYFIPCRKDKASTLDDFAKKFGVKNWVPK